MTERGFIARCPGLRPASHRCLRAEHGQPNCRLVSTTNARRGADPDARHGELGILNTKNPVVSLIDAPASVSVLYAKYCAAHARWHSRRSEGNRTAIREAYDAWATAFLGEVNSRPVIISAARFWGAA